MCSAAIEDLSLCVGSSGEVWVDAPPYAELLPQLLPEDLTDVWNDNRDWQILGQSGTVYVLPKPAELVSRILSPPRRMDKVVRLGKSLMGVAQGRLLRTDDGGTSWQAQSIEARYPIDIAVDAAGRVALLDIPERLWQSTDVGQYFVPLDRHANGATALIREGNELRAVSLLSGRAPILPQWTASVAPIPKASLRHPVADYLTPSDFVDGHVAEIGTSFLVARQQKDAWQLRQGRLGRPLDPPSTARGLACQRALFATTKNQVWALCSGEIPPDLAQPITVFVSENQGQKFTRVKPSLHGVPKNIRTASSAEALGLLVTGVCAPHGSGPEVPTRDDNAAGCLPRGIYRFDYHQREGSDAPSSLSIAQLPTPALTGSAAALAMPRSGMIVAAVARRTKTGALTLLISHDGSRSFVAVPLFGSANQVALDSDSVPQSAGNRARRSKHTAPIEKSFELTSLSVSEDGTISLTTKHGDHPRWSTFDARGNLLSVADAPEGTSQLSVVDHRALALSVTEGVLYESTDGGADFEPIAELGSSACVGSKPCRLVCTRTGCLVGDQLVRLGFSHRIQPRLGLPSQLALHGEESRKTDPMQLASCEISQTGWQPLPGASPLPNAASASFGNLLFYRLALAPDDSNLILSEAAGPQPTWTSKRVFSPISSEAESALAVQRSDHGWAAARIRRVGTSADPIGIVDFSWSNLSGAPHTTVQARFDQRVGTLSIEKTSSGHARFAAALLAPSQDGLLVALGAPQPSGKTAAHWITPTRTSVLAEFGGWQGQKISGSEILSVLGQAMPVGLAADGMVLLRGSLTERHVAAITVAPNPELLHGAHAHAKFAHWGSSPGVFIPVPFAEDDGERVQFYRVVANESVIEPGPIVPLPFGKRISLGACDRSRLVRSKRLVVGSNSQEILHIDVQRSTSPPQQLTLTRAVLYADMNDACWAVLEATDASMGTSALLFAQNPPESFIFRSSEDLTGADQTEYATMSCRVGDEFRLPKRSHQP